MRRIVLLISTSFFLLQVLRAQQLRPVFNSLGPNTNGYYEYLPENYSATRVEKYPLLVFIEGSGELGNGTTPQINVLTGSGPLFYIKQNDFPTSFTVNGKTFQFVIITPQFVVRPSPSDIDKVITSSLEKYNVDINRIYLTGFSMGGGVSLEYAGNSPGYAQKLAALIPFSSATEPSWSAVIPRAKNIAGANLPVWAFHNHGDEVSDTITKNYVSFINKFAEFTGGGISPGMDMRFKSLNTFTALLPVIKEDWNFPLIGYDTRTNILSGVILGMAKEIDGFIDAYGERYGNFNVLLTGGNCTYFVPHLKNQIFADPDLLFKGLYAISECNNQ